MRNQLKYLVNLSKNTVSLLGVGITTISAILMMVLFTMEFLDYLANPYVGILTYLILPVIFITGLLFIPFGIWLTQRRRHRLEAAGEELPPLTYPAWDFNDARVRKTALIVVFATVANVVVLSTATYKGVHHMESVEFCGTVCHTVMKPEFTLVPGITTFPRRLHELPHRSGCIVVCEIQAVRFASGGCRRIQYLPETHCHACP